MAVPRKKQNNNKLALDSWIDIPSQPSSSSLSSSTDEIVTQGLRVQSSHEDGRRRPSPLSAAHMRLRLADRHSSASSSQDEYEESESESDRVMTSSNEGYSSRSSDRPRSSDNDEANDSADENATALGVGTNHHCFTPQPNAFSHPPSSQSRSRDNTATGSYFSSARQPSGSSARTQSYRRNSSRQNHSPYNTVSPSHHADQDAALRASLSTLLSLGAAARGLPKSGSNPKTPASTQNQNRNNRIDPSTLRMTTQPPMDTDNNTKPARRRRSSSGNSSDSTGGKGKRKASRSHSKESPAAKRFRPMRVEDSINPTLLTWVVSAGVLVIVSALSFSAGYSVGKETGRIEGTWSVRADNLGSCGKDAGKSGLGLRRRLLGGAARVVAS
ncbi:MAG: hypothetical protein M1831_004508 [Alyxoria varia]|nr:MAG: hypothetical protein M1831_004508 [Alyxoria varia]